MDTIYHSNIPIETLSLLDCDVRNFNFIHPIKNIFFDNIDYIRKLDASGKARPCILDNAERSLLCHTCYLGFDQFECPNCDNWNVVPHSCHSRFCNACGVKYAKQLVAKAISFCLDCPHRHIVFTIPKELRNWFRQDRTQLNLLFVAARNTISILTNKSLADKLKKKKLSDTHYIFKDISVRNEFSMIATIHTFGRDLKWNPHIHCLVPELVYSQKTNKLKMFHHFNFSRLRKTFQYQLIHLIIEFGGLSKLEERNRLYKEHPKGFYGYAKSKSDNHDSNNGKNIQGYINYFIRHVGRPAMAENRITEYNKESKTVSWFYNDHKDETRTKALKNKLNKFKYRTHLIDSFNRDPIQCKCGAIMQYTYTYNPLEDKRNDRTYRKRCIDEMYKMRLRRRST